MRIRASLSLALSSVVGLALLIGPIQGSVASVAPAADLVDSPTDSVYDAVVGPDGTTYAVGSFTAAGAATGSMARLDATYGTVDRSFPMVNGNVEAMVTDSQGSIYIGGDFIAVGGQSRWGLAKLNADGSVTDWAPQLGDGRVTTLLIDGDALYVGGSFSSINGLPRMRIAAIDSTTGEVTGWAPVLNRTPPYVFVDALAMDDTYVYLGGTFDTVDGEDLANLARFTRTTGQLDTTWEPDPNYGVRSITPDDSLIYIGGYFTQIGGQSRTRVAALDAATGAPANWYPSIDQSVESILVDDTTVYIGGGFFQVEGQTRFGIAALNADDTGTLVTSWNPTLPYTGAVEALLKSGTDLYVGSGRLDKLNIVTGTLEPSWDPRPGSGRFLGLTMQGSSLVVAGSFTHMNTVERQGAAAFDSSGRVTDWDPNLNSNAFAIELAGSAAYVVGDFSVVNGGLARDHAAAFNLDDTGVATPWNPGVDSSIYDIEIQGSTAYIAGDFSDVGGESRNYLAAVSLSATGLPTDWDPSLNYSGYDIALYNGLAYVVGDFSNVNGSPESREYAAAFHLDDTGTATDWSPDMDSYGYGITISNGTAFVVGDFTAVNQWGGAGVPRNHAAAFSLDDSGAATAWDPDASGPVYDVTLSAGYAYLLGDFGTINGSVTRQGLAAVDATGAGLVSESWVPVARGGFDPGSFYEGGLALAGSTLMAMGGFPSVTLNGVDYSGSLAKLPLIGASPPPAPATPTHPPSAPLDVTAKPGDARIAVTWRPPLSTGTFPVSTYRVTSQPGGQTCLTSEQTCTLTGLTNGREYAVTVAALSGAGWGNTSEPVYATAGSASAIQVTGSRDGRVIRISGTSTELGVGAELVPWFQFGGQSVFTRGTARILVDIDGDFTWQRKTGKRIRVYVEIPDGSLRSNAVTIPTTSG